MRERDLLDLGCGSVERLGVTIIEGARLAVAPTMSKPSMATDVAIATIIAVVTSRLSDSSRRMHARATGVLTHPPAILGRPHAGNEGADLVLQRLQLLGQAAARLQHQARGLAGLRRRSR